LSQHIYPIVPYYLSYSIDETDFFEDHPQISDLTEKLLSLYVAIDGTANMDIFIYRKSIHLVLHHIWQKPGHTQALRVSLVILKVF